MLTQGILCCIYLHGVAICDTWIVAETALITELTHSLFEEATSDNISRAMGWCLVDTCIISIPLYMSIPAVVPLAASAILEVSKTKHVIIRHGKKHRTKIIDETRVAFEIIVSSVTTRETNIRLVSIFILLYSSVLIECCYSLRRLTSPSRFT